MTDTEFVQGAPDTAAHLAAGSQPDTAAQPGTGAQSEIAAHPDSTAQPDANDRKAIPAEIAGPGERHEWAFADGDRTRQTWRRIRVAAARLALGVAGGFVLDLAFPAVGWWPGAVIGTAMLLGSVYGMRFWPGYVIGAAGTLAFYLVHIEWATLYLGAIPWLALSASQALIFGLFLAGFGSCARRLARNPQRWVTWLAVPLLAAAWWVAGETVTAAWPYGGFSWGRLAFAHSQGPFSAAASWIGASGLSMLLAALAGVLLQCAVAAARAVATRNFVGALANSGRGLLRFGLGWSVVVAVAALIAPFPQKVVGSVTVAAVQGDGPAGYFTPRAAGDLLASQAAATERFVDGNKVDLIVWPEDGSDLDPTRDLGARKVISELTARNEAPLVFGTITKRGDEYFNSSLVWPAGGSAATAIYDKKHPVPFGEYVPHRSFYSRIVPGLIGLIGRDYVPGTASNVLPVGSGRFGSAICFDIAYDDVARSIVADGGQAILAQSNNGDFGTTDESVQQLAIARLRAIETGRTVVNVSTVGTSAIIDADGTTLAELSTFQPGAMIQQIQLREGTTLGIRLGPVLAWSSVLVSGAGALVLIGLRLRERRRGRE
ncbi:apolipoprotein N-acyltransferase [Rarobacter faecitabidus]|uniref:Apolipoprotein N-acyltransferase n=1 Tax=Rarobacter faecitabidus TaxID=13243 RepID=A0A542ZVY0_RARFA|nr:apolipoprotein N-acyltransferase [Rarobacter faecitabidus]TQL64406.1 apolipoprotein N-acyltransferase [Rarobacter faecitabidus]